MKTSIYNLDLMQSGAGANQNLIYNENLLKIDCLMNGNISDFAKDIPNNIAVGEKFIITDGQHKGKICYKTHNQKPPTFFPVYRGQVFFVNSANNFFIYDGKDWSPFELTQTASHASSSSSSSANTNVAVGSNSLLTGKEKFTGIQDEYFAPEDHEFLHLYVNDDVQINLDNVKTRLVTFIIKQHYQSAKQFNWPHNILWPNKTPHKLTDEANATDIVRIYRLVETNHFLGEIVGQNYQF